MTARDCPGAFRCPSGHDCFAESARARAAEADVVVVNTHLYGAHVASGGSVLPDHDVVVFDEAHEVEEVMTDSLGLDIGPGRFRSLATAVRPLLPTAAADRVAGLVEVAEALESALRPLAGRRVPPGGLDPPGPDDGSGAGDPLARALALAGTRVALVAESLRRSAREGDAGAGPDGGARRARLDRALLAAGHLADDLARLPGLGDDHVAWVEDGGNRPPSLRISPIEVGPILAGALWEHVTSVLTSATVPLHLAGRLGLPDEDTDEADVGSPFDYRTHAVLYVAADLPDRRTPAAEPAILDEIEALITAAGGRTLALFTSWRAMHAARSTLAERLPFRVLAQSDLPKPALVEAFAADEATCLFATLGFWQGVDVPGRTLSLVTIDRIPFPRPDDPVLEARRERAGAGAFRLVDLPRAGTLLAQGAGRLIRSAADQGVVAILDSRLATARYRGELLARVPPCTGASRAPRPRRSCGGSRRADEPAGPPRSQSEAVEGVVAVLPPLLHPHEQLEVGARLHLGAHGRAHRLQGRPALADHDALLRVALHHDLAAHPGPLPLGHPAGDAVGQLVGHPGQQLLAHEVGHPERLGHVGDHPLGVVAGTFGHAGHHGVDERVDAVPGPRRTPGSSRPAARRSPPAPDRPTRRRRRRPPSPAARRRCPGRPGRSCSRPPPTGRAPGPPPPRVRPPGPGAAPGR